MTTPDHHPHRPALPTHVTRQMRRMITDTRRTHGRANLTDLEEHLLNVRRDHDEHTHQQRQRSTKRLPSRIQHATNRWSIAASQVAIGLTSATVDQPPQRPERTGFTSKSVSDPTSTAVSATLTHIETSAVTFVHLTTPCMLDGQHDRDDGRCPAPHAIDLATHADLHLNADAQADNVLGATCQTAGWNDAVHALASWHTITAAQLLDRFWTAYRGAASIQIAETSALEAWVSATEDLVRRLDRLAGNLAQWSGRDERRCKAGCGAAVPLRPDQQPRQGAMCNRCAQRQHRHQTS